MAWRQIDFDALERCRGDVREIEAIEKIVPKRSGGEFRGNVYDRRRRKQKLIDTYGDGTLVACRHCWTSVTESELAADRKVPGKDGGRYTWDNIQPSCLPCSHAQGAQLRSR